MLLRLRGLIGERGSPAGRTLEDRFTRVFNKRMWRSRESVSGLGSERGSGSVAHALELLDRFTREHGLSSIADVPCGDFNWMPGYLERHPNVQYTGYDVVPALIEQNRRKWPGRRFEVLDITKARPEPADLLFCKDLLNHLVERDVWAALGNMVASKPKFLMMTTNRGFANTELKGWRASASRNLDLQAPPYAMPPPLYGDHYLLLWRCEDVARHLEGRAR